MGRFPLAALLAVSCLSGVPAAAGSAMDTGSSVQPQQGRVLTDSDANESASGGVISRQSALELRKQLKPLLERISTRGMRTAEAEYSRALRKWAKDQDERLLEHQKVHTAYERLGEYRDRSAARGDDTSRIDPRLKGMEKKLEKSSDSIRRAYADLERLVEHHQQSVPVMSALMRERQDTARTIIQNTRS